MFSSHCFKYNCYDYIFREMSKESINDSIFEAKKFLNSFSKKYPDEKSEENKYVKYLSPLKNEYWIKIKPQNWHFLENT